MPDSQNTVSPTPQGGQGFPADNRDGTPGLIGKDDFTKQYEIDRINRGSVTVLAGNFADLQRLGAQAATGTVNVNAAIATGPGVNPKADNVLTPAQHDTAKGEATVESIRAGLMTEPVPPAPKDNREPNSVDPTSVSPTATKAATK